MKSVFSWNEPLRIRGTEEQKIILSWSSLFLAICFRSAGRNTWANIFIMLQFMQSLSMLIAEACPYFTSFLHIHTIILSCDMTVIMASLWSSVNMVVLNMVVSWEPIH